MKTSTKIIITAIVTLAIIILTGCIADNFWPTNVDRLGTAYVGGEPNKISMLPIGPHASNLANARELRDNIELTHSEKQLQYQMYLDVDNSKYGIVSQRATANVREGEQSYNEVIGTLASPGWGLGILLALGAGVGMKFYDKGTMYSETEHQTALNTTAQTAYRQGLYTPVPSATAPVKA